MHPLLQKALQKLGLKSFNDLNELEKETFKTWENVLRGKKITQEDVVEQLKEWSEKMLEECFTNDVSEKRRSYLLSQVEVVKYIVKLVENPKADVKRVEQEIENLAGR